VFVKSEQKLFAESEQGEIEKYSRIPDSVLFDERLSMADRCVYAVLARHVFQGTTVKIGQRRIAKDLRCHVATVNSGIHELAACGHICIRSRGRSRGMYHLSSRVFGQKQRAGIEEAISSPSRMLRLASTRTA